MRQLSSPLAFMILLSTLGTRPNSSMGYRVASSNLNAYPALTDVLRACRHTELVKNYQRLAIWRKRGGELARPAGLEPATPGLEGRCSIRLSYGRVGRNFTLIAPRH